MAQGAASTVLRRGRHGYRRAWLGKDLVGGLAAGAVVIPQAMAYATIADLPAQVGLYTCMVPMAVYALLGGSRTLSVSTTSTIAVLTGSTLLAAGVAAGARTTRRGRLATLTLLVGAILARRPAAAPRRRSSTTSPRPRSTGIKVGVGPDGRRRPAAQAARHRPATRRPTTSSPRCAPSSTISATSAGRRSRSRRRRSPSCSCLRRVRAAGARARSSPSSAASCSSPCASIDEHGVALIAAGARPACRRRSRRPFDDSATLVAGRVRHRHHGASSRRSPSAAPCAGPTEPPIDNDQELARQRPGLRGRRLLPGHAVRRRVLADRDQPAGRRPHPAQRAGHRRCSPSPARCSSAACSATCPQATLGLHGRRRRARADQAGRVRAVLAAQPHRVLGRRAHRRQRACASACSPPCSSAWCSPCCS